MIFFANRFEVPCRSCLPLRDMGQNVIPAVNLSTHCSSNVFYPTLCWNRCMANGLMLRYAIIFKNQRRQNKMSTHYNVMTALALLL